MTNSPHVFSLHNLKPQVERPGGSRAAVNASIFPMLRGLSLYRALLTPLGFREPHWHPNANELSYCVRGEALVTIFSNGSFHDTFAVRAGEMFFVPSGYLHHFENTGANEAEFIIAFSHEMPEDFGISGAVGCMSNNVLGNTFGLSGQAFDGLRKSPEDTVFGLRKQPAVVPFHARFPNQHTFAVETMSPPIATSDGLARTAKKAFWPILEDISMFSLRISDKGMREPHWHPRTAEMGYVLEGRARMTVLSPGARVDTYELSPGDLYFIPRAYPHHIENIGTEEIRFLIFFDRGNTEDIGYTGGLRAYSNEVLGATFDCDPKFFEKLPAYSEDALIVGRRNPVEP
jgi:oxalate decarboxylase